MNDRHWLDWVRSPLIAGWAAAAYEREPHPPHSVDEIKFNVELVEGQLNQLTAGKLRNSIYLLGCAGRWIGSRLSGGASVAARATNWKGMICINVNTDWLRGSGWETTLLEKLNTLSSGFDVPFTMNEWGRDREEDVYYWWWNFN